jgi:hypothetical protein
MHNPTELVIRNVRKGPLRCSLWWHGKRVGSCFKPDGASGLTVYWRQQRIGKYFPNRLALEEHIERTAARQLFRRMTRKKPAAARTVQ